MGANHENIMALTAHLIIEQLPLGYLRSTFTIFAEHC